MKSAKCDVCGEDFDRDTFQLTELLPEYQSDKIKDVFTDCYREVQSAMTKINDVLEEVRASWLRRVIQKMRRRNLITL